MKQLQHKPKQERGVIVVNADTGTTQKREPFLCICGAYRATDLGQETPCMLKKTISGLVWETQNDCLQIAFFFLGGVSLGQILTGSGAGGDCHLTRASAPQIFPLNCDNAINPHVVLVTQDLVS